MATRWIITHPTPEKALHPSFTPGQQVTIVRDAEPNNFCEVQMFESGELARLPWCCLAPSSWYHGLMTPATAERELRLQRKSHSSRSSGSGTPLSPVAGGSPAQNTAGVFLIRTDDFMQQLVLSLSTDTEVHHFPITVCALGFSLACDTSSVFPTLMTLVEYFSVASGPLPCTLKCGVPFLPFSLRQPSAKSLASAAASLSHHPPAATLSPVGCPHLCTDRFFSLLFSEAFRGRDLTGVTLALPHHLGVHISVLLSLLQQFPNHTSALVAAELIEPVTASLCNLMLADYRAVRNLQLDSQPLVAPATCYLSHNPGSSFRTLVDAAVQYDNKHSHANNYFWVDFLCQYGPIPSDMCTDTDPDTTPSRFVPFGEAPAKTHVFLTSSAVPPTQVAAAATPGPPTISELVRAIGTVTLVATPTSAPAALNHPSCLREMFAALETSVHLRITLSSSELSFFKAAMLADARALFSSFVSIDIGRCAEALSLEPVVDGDRGDAGGGAGGEGRHMATSMMAGPGTAPWGSGGISSHTSMHNNGHSSGGGSNGKGPLPKQPAGFFLDAQGLMKPYYLVRPPAPSLTPAPTSSTPPPTAAPQRAKHRAGGPAGSLVQYGQ
eukprot:m.44475 g.44475  ORF g.44475 m.44475 type:complete len:610 (+) comp10915_c3_seq1:80-1909(+)